MDRKSSDRRAEPLKTALVIGASGGLGQALTLHLSQRADVGAVLALSRKRPETAHQPDIDNSNIEWMQADTADQAGLQDAARRIGATHSRIHLLINCTGTLHGGDAKPDFKPEKALAELRPENLHRCMQVNAFAPLAALQAFAPLLHHDEGAIAATLSAMVGSIGDNQLGGWYSYRMSKAALNMGLRNAAIEFARRRNGPVVVAIHPGTTLTTLSEPFVKRHKHRPPEESATLIMKVIDSLEPEDSGKFFHWDGSELPW
jgi:NAD(P)-dependent dehydrogenase (short-subunit alcohol dehydrogenase family)